MSDECCHDNLQVRSQLDTVDKSLKSIPNSCPSLTTGGKHRLSELESMTNSHTYIHTPGLKYRI